jgi:lipoate-protein ligase A
VRPKPTEPSTSNWRLLVDREADAATNMAVDEALLDSYLSAAGAACAPTLRLYGWNPPALSLGKGQPAGDGHDPAFLSREGIDLIRRPTGGQAVLHEGERTYCVVGRLDRSPFDRGVLATYLSISAALRRAFEILGVSTGIAPQVASPPSGPVCFNTASTHELLHEGRKVVGSAQMRRRQAFLQHGSIPYRADATRLGRAIGVPVDGERFAGLQALLGRLPQDDELDAALIEGFSQAFAIELAPGRRTAWEQERAERLRCWKYLSLAWTHDGKPGAVERSHAPAGLFGGL